MKNKLRKQKEKECLKLVSDSTELYTDIINDKISNLKELHNDDKISSDDFNAWQSRFKDVLSKIEVLNQQISNYEKEN